MLPVTIVIVHLCISLHPLIWVFFYSKYVKWAPFFHFAQFCINWCMLNQHLLNQDFIFTDQIKNEPKLFGQSKIRNILKFRINKVSIFYWRKKKKIHLELTKGKDLAPITNRKMTFVIVMCNAHDHLIIWVKWVTKTNIIFLLVFRAKFCP